MPKTEGRFAAANCELSALLVNGRFSKAEPLVREGVQQKPSDIFSLARLEVLLNVQGKNHLEPEIQGRVDFNRDLQFRRSCGGE